MNKTSLLLGLSSIIIAGAVMVPGVVNAYKGDVSVRGPNYTPERHAAMTKAFETKDYNAWKSLMTGRGRITQVINESNFAKFAEAHQNGNLNQIRAELGLGQGRGRNNK